MSLLKNDQTDEDLPPIRFEIRGSEIDLSKANRLLRKLLTSVGKKQQKRFGHLVHPETGERPTIVLAVPDPSKPAVQCRLDTKSPVLRAWLKDQGIVIDEKFVPLEE